MANENDHEIRDDFYLNSLRTCLNFWYKKFNSLTRTSNGTPPGGGRGGQKGYCQNNTRFSAFKFGYLVPRWNFVLFCARSEISLRKTVTLGLSFIVMRGVSHNASKRSKPTLFLIFLLIFFSDFSSALVSGNLVGIG